MEEGSTIIAAFDNDRAGDELTNRLADLVNATNRKDLHFKEDRPQVRNADWNKVLMQEAVRAGRIQVASPSLLIETDLSIASIAHCCGFSDGASVSHAFRKYFDITPGELRRAR